jgi:hypothetical protein
LLLSSGAMAERPSPGRSGLKLEDIPVNGSRAYGYLKRICAIGPRMSGSEGMLAQQELVAEHLQGLGGHVTFQRFRARHPLDGTLVRMANVICEWHPERKRRVLLCTHYDTRPLPDRDRDPRRRRHGTFIGANDGGSGVAVLMELAHEMPSLQSRYGVDFVFLDGEEFVYDDGRDPYFLGSTWFAQKYVSDPPEHRYRWGVLLDMVGDADLQIYQERFSMGWKDTRPLVLALWATAHRLGVREFIGQMRHRVRDDHLKLRNVGKIPTCNIIDFDYPYWHTEGDTAAKCSPLSLAKVGWVVREWLQTAE